MEAKRSFKSDAVLTGPIKQQNEVWTLWTVNSQRQQKNATIPVRTAVK